MSELNNRGTLTVAQLEHCAHAVVRKNVPDTHPTGDRCPHGDNYSYLTRLIMLDISTRRHGKISEWVEKVEETTERARVYTPLRVLGKVSCVSCRRHGNPIAHLFKDPKIMQCRWLRMRKLRAVPDDVARPGQYRRRNIMVVMPLHRLFQGTSANAPAQHPRPLDSPNNSQLTGWLTLLLLRWSGDSVVAANNKNRILRNLRLESEVRTV